MSDKNFEAETNKHFSDLSSEWIDDFKNRIPAGIKEKAELSAVSDIKYSKNDFMSIITEKTVYTGGAHGNMWRYTSNIDVKQSKKVQLDDLFIDNKYREFINCRMDEMIKNEPDKYSELWQKPVIGDRQSEDFYIHDGKLVIFYQPYDLSYYAKGFIEFPLSIQSLSGYIKPEYAERFE